MVGNILVLSQKRVTLSHRFKVILLIMLVTLLIPPVVAIASELGGYTTEKLIGRTGVADTNLLIARDGVVNSFLDIARLFVPPPVPPGPGSSNSTGLFGVIPILLVFYAIYAILRLITGNPTIKELVIVAVIAYFLVASLSGLQPMLDNILP